MTVLLAAGHPAVAGGLWSGPAQAGLRSRLR